MATGRAIGSGLLGKDMTARTEGLKVDNFSYNGAVLGNADLKGPAGIWTTKCSV